MLAFLLIFTVFIIFTATVNIARNYEKDKEERDANREQADQ